MKLIVSKKTKSTQWKDNAPTKSFEILFVAQSTTYTNSFTMDLAEDEYNSYSIGEVIEVTP